MPKKFFLISDGSDLAGITIANNIRYIRILRNSMLWLYAWPRKAVGEKERKTMFYERIFIISLIIACIISSSIYVKNNTAKLSFFELGHTYITILMTVVCLVRSFLIISPSYHKLMADFLAKIHLLNWKEKSDYAMKQHLLIHKMCHFFTMYIFGTMYSGMILFNMTPIYNNITTGAYNPAKLGKENVTLQLAVYYALPFDYMSTYKGYAIVFSFNCYVSYMCSCWFCIIDLMMTVFVIHIWGHLNIITYYLENFTNIQGLDGERNVPWYTEEENHKAFLGLRDIIIYHSQIVKFITRMSQIFGPSLLVYYAFHQTSLCLLLLECSQMSTEVLLRYGPLTVILFQQLIQLSLIFELLGSMTDKLVNGAYSVPWELMDTRNRKLVIVMLRQTQLPLNLKALGLVTVGCQTMVAIIKTSMSYFVMLQAVAEGGSPEAA